MAMDSAPSLMEHDTNDGALPALGVPPRAGSVSEGAAQIEIETDGHDRGDFEVYFSRNVPNEKQMPYILMMANDCFRDFDVRDVHPYSAFLTNRKLGGGGWVRQLKAGKDLVVQELKRRDPAARPNKSNKGVDEITQLLKERPITDPRDLAFIERKEGEFRQKLMDMLKECQSGKVARKKLLGKRPRIEYSDDGVQDEAVDCENAYSEERIETLQSNGSITYLAAEKVMDVAEQLALSKGWKVSIAIADANGNPMMVKRLLDAFPASFEVAVGKAKAAVQCYKNVDYNIFDAHDVSRGGLAIIIDGVCCGGIGVSGQKPAKLEKVAIAGIEALRYYSVRQVIVKNAAECDEATEENLFDM
mmetsp:Transcript_19013/g.32703  ORF Transcript_19013/g.32703 Transcript_19013/m.32703 type:complete len:360 (+) Transcript_19013:81-1160(+)|eukprot:CAMPEP_0183706236 /NCGR_PEP_ID=MMETSP0737-20130205/3126_1 /TAXON_ID=385413 /ORGANISM="Thalassiosira miniscula, Strain CCMP1093" /LENGTH=359 /DNA_ID=CAMNT_0025933603 /DNA_START=89 /DNA_END=1168 /DNA_ORIENTATION=+